MMTALLENLTWMTQIAPLQSSLPELETSKCLEGDSGDVLAFAQLIDLNRGLDTIFSCGRPADLGSGAALAANFDATKVEWWSITLLP